MIAEVKRYSFKVCGDERGSLVPIESLNDIPFEIKRVYYIYETKENVVRGKHAHKQLEQILIAVSGSVTVDVEYDGKFETFVLDNPTQGLYIKGKVWREMKWFSGNCVLLVLASDYYKEEDYIRDFDLFKENSNDFH